MSSPNYLPFSGTQEEAESFLDANMELAKTWIVNVPRKTLESWVAEKRLSVRGSEQQTIHIRDSSKLDSAGGNLFEQVHECSLLFIHLFVCRFVRLFICLTIVQIHVVHRK